MFNHLTILPTAWQNPELDSASFFSALQTNRCYGSKNCFHAVATSSLISSIDHKLINKTLGAMLDWFFQWTLSQTHHTYVAPACACSCLLLLALVAAACSANLVQKQTRIIPGWRQSALLHCTHCLLCIKHGCFPFIEWPMCWSFLLLDAFSVCSRFHSLFFPCSPPVTQSWAMVALNTPSKGYSFFSDPFTTEIMDCPSWFLNEFLRITNTTKISSSETKQRHAYESELAENEIYFMNEFYIEHLRHGNVSDYCCGNCTFTAKKTAW